MLILFLVVVQTWTVREISKPSNHKICFWVNYRLFCFFPADWNRPSVFICTVRTFLLPACEELQAGLVVDRLPLCLPPLLHAGTFSPQLCPTFIPHIALQLLCLKARRTRFSHCRLARKSEFCSPTFLKSENTKLYFTAGGEKIQGSHKPGWRCETRCFVMLIPRN